MGCFSNSKLHVVDFFELVEEPRVHRSHLRDLLDRVSLAQRVAHVGQAARDAA
jgi:hypothetical protein